MTSTDDLRARLWLAVFALAAPACGDARAPAAPVATTTAPPAPRTPVATTTTAARDGGFQLLAPDDPAKCVPANGPEALASRDHGVEEGGAAAGCPRLLGHGIERGLLRMPDGREVEHEMRGEVRGLDVAKTAQVRAAGQADLCCYAPEPPGTGRAYGDARGEHRAAVPASTTTPRAAAVWLAAAAAEHASVASFARTTLELMALGAPLDLIACVQRAALDEVAHAELSLAVARRLGADAGAFGPLAPLPPRALDHVGLAVATLVEAAVPETIGAAIVRAAAQGADADLRPTLLRIADDEERHAALAWRTLRWAVAAGGPSVAAALLAVDVAAVVDDGATIDDGDDGAAPIDDGEDGLAAAGLLGRSAREVVAARVARTVVGPLRDAIAAA